MAKLVGMKSKIKIELNNDRKVKPLNEEIIAESNDTAKYSVQGRPNTRGRIITEKGLVHLTLYRHVLWLKQEQSAYLLM